MRVLPLRPPLLQAKMLRTLDLMSKGRLIVGAAGGSMKAEIDVLEWLRCVEAFAKPIERVA